MNNILVAIELKPTDSWLLFHASALAEKFQSKIWLVHISPPDPDFVGFEMGPKYIREYLAHELRAEHRQLQAYAHDMKQKGLEVECLMIQGPTAEMIETEVEKLGIDLLILGSHRHNFLYEAFVGHTESRVIRDIAIPVLIVPLPYETK